MATYYVGPGGNDANSGLTWPLRKLTLNGAEDVPVAAGDTVYVGPGVYRETLTCDINGAPGNWITYIGDVTGEHTDGVGGLVRISGSDTDMTKVRANAILLNWREYRLFRGFVCDMATGPGLRDPGGNTVIEDCVVMHCDHGFYSWQPLDLTIRRCLFWTNSQHNIQFDGAGADNRNCLIENCVLIGPYPWGACVDNRGNGGTTVRNCLVYTGWVGLATSIAFNPGQTMTVENCIITGCMTGVSAAVLGDLVEDFNTFFNNSADRVNVAVGASSQTYPPLFLPPLLYSGAGQVSGIKFPWWFASLSEWSPIQAITGANEPTEDFLGIARPATASKNSWGPVQFHDMERDTGTVYEGAASMALHDAGRHQIWVPAIGTSTAVSIWVYREANYAGTLPQMVIKQPGQADRITTDTGAAATWNELSDTFTPASTPPYVVVELTSLNTAVAGNYTVYFDDLNVVI